MNSNNLRERYFKGRVYIALTPAILFASCVWFTPNLVAIKLAHGFQLYFSLLLCLASSYLWSQSKITVSIFPENFAFRMALVLLITTVGGGLLTLYVNPVYGLSLILTALLSLFLFGLPDQTKVQSPFWFKELIRKSNIMLCICLIVMLAYWLNPYTEPLNHYLK